MRISILFSFAFRFSYFHPNFQQKGTVFGTLNQFHFLRKPTIYVVERWFNDGTVKCQLFILTIIIAGLCLLLLPPHPPNYSITLRQLKPYLVPKYVILHNLILDQRTHIIAKSCGHRYMTRVSLVLYTHTASSKSYCCKTAEWLFIDSDEVPSWKWCLRR